MSLRRNLQSVPFLDLSSIKESDVDLLDLAKRQYEEEGARWSQVEEKARTLLTVAGLLVPISAALLPLASSKMLASIGLALLLLTTFIILQIFGVGTWKFPSVDAELVAASKDLRFQLLIEQFLSSAAANNCANNFRVDLYRSAHRLFLTSLFFIALNGVGAMGTAAIVFDLARRANEFVGLFSRLFS